jgi:hypothetical protein
MSETKYHDFSCVSSIFKGKDRFDGARRAIFFRTIDCNSKHPLMRSTKELTIKLENHGCLAAKDLFFSISKNEALAICLWPVLQRDLSRGEGL